MKLTKYFKIGMLVLGIVLVIGIIIYIAPVITELNTPNGQIAFRDKINNSGFLGFLWLFGIQVVQIFLIFIPGEPIEILAGMCYGSIWGTVFIMVSAALISTAIFFLVRKLGRRFVCHFWSDEKVAKIVDSKLFQNPKKIEKILLILFLLPGTPKDFLSYIAGLLPIKPIKFIIISSLARFPSVISSTMAGANLVVGNWKMSLIVYLVTFLIVGIIMFIMNKLDKSKVTEETLQAFTKENF